MKWTDEKLAELRVLFDEGYTLSDMAHRIGATEYAVRHIIKKKRMKRPRLVRRKVDRHIVNSRVYQAIAALIDAKSNLTKSGLLAATNERLADVAGCSYKTDKISCVLNDLRDSGLIEVTYGAVRTIRLLRIPYRISDTITAAATNAERPDHVVKKRKCLSCQQPFHSDWHGNRICTPCKNTQAWNSGPDAAYPAA